MNSNALHTNSAAITGVGCVTAYGRGVPAMWRGVNSLCDAIKSESPGKPYLPEQVLAARVPSLDDVKLEVKFVKPSRASLMARLAANEAWSMSGIGNCFDPDRTGLVINRNFGEHEFTGHYYERLWDKGPGSVSGLHFVQTIANAPLGQLALGFGLRGPSLMELGPPSLGIALDTLRDRKADVMVAGSVDELSDYVLTLCNMSGTAAHHQEDCRHPRPYDRGRAGLVPGEAAVFFVLETVDHCVARGGQPLGYLRGYGSVADRCALENPLHRTEEDTAAAITTALDDSGVGANGLAAISGAGAGLHGFDEVELQAIGRALASSPPVFSIKGALGETWGAAGGLAMLTGLLSLKENYIPRTLHFSDPIDPSVHVTREPVNVRGGAVLSMSFDMCGQTNALVCAAEP